MCGSSVSCNAGNHGLQCHTGVKARKATILERTLEKLYRDAGGVPTRQPSTYNLLGDCFYKEDVSRLFCGGLTKPEAERRKVLAMRYLDIISSTPRGYRQTAELGILRENEFPPPTVAEDEEGNGTIRFDLRFPAYGPPDFPREL